MSTPYSPHSSPARAATGPGYRQLLTPREQLIITALSLGVGMLYHVVFLRWKAATVGKLICGLRVVPVDRGRFTETLGWNTVGIRSAFRVMPGITSVLTLFVLLDSLFPLWHPKRQAIHDLAAKTQVIRPRRVRPPNVTTSLRNSRGAWRFRAFDDYIEPRSERSGRSHPVKPNGSGATVQ